MADEKHDVDAFTGTGTTGHAWDGIRELNTPLPRWWLYVFYAWKPATKPGAPWDYRYKAIRYMRHKLPLR